jgi:hypothetical protein
LASRNGAQITSNPPALAVDQCGSKVDFEVYLVFDTED